MTIKQPHKNRFPKKGFLVAILDSSPILNKIWQKHLKEKRKKSLISLKRNLKRPLFPLFFRLRKMWYICKKTWFFLQIIVCPLRQRKVAPNVCTEYMKTKKILLFKYPGKILLNVFKRGSKRHLFLFCFKTWSFFTKNIGMSKGRIISEANFLILNSSKKRTKN